jgi:hypothetical protein
LIQLTANEVVRRAIEVAQIGTADIPFDTMTFLLDQQYRRLVSDYGRIVRGGYGIVSEPLECIGPNLWNPPDGVVARVYYKSAYNEVDLTEEPFYYGQPDQGHYVIRDAGIVTACREPLWVDYSKWPMTPTFTRKAIPLESQPDRIYYDSDSGTIATLVGAQLTVNENGNIQTFSNVYDIAGGPHELWVLTSTNLYEHWTGRSVQRDPGSVRLFFDQKTKTIRNTAADFQTYYWNSVSLSIINKRILIDGIDVTDDYFIEETINEIVVSYPRIFVSYLKDGMNRCRVIGIDGSIYELEDENDSPIKLVRGSYTSDRTGYGLGAYIGNFPFIIGWTPCTRFDFDKSLYFDVMVTRLAISILSYLGLGVDGQVALADRLEQEAFKQTKRTRTTNRIRNLRRVR